MPRPRPATLVVEEVDLLPEDESSVDDVQVEWVKKAEFRASVTGAHISKDGELTLSIKVPHEDKYLALPLTDVRSILMVFSAYEPTQVDERGDLDAVWKGDNGGR